MGNIKGEGWKIVLMFCFENGALFVGILELTPFIKGDKLDLLELGTSVRSYRTPSCTLVALLCLQFLPFYLHFFYLISDVFFPCLGPAETY